MVYGYNVYIDMNDKDTHKQEIKKVKEHKKI